MLVTQVTLTLLSLGLILGGTMLANISLLSDSIEYGLLFFGGFLAIVGLGMLIQLVRENYGEGKKNFLIVFFANNEHLTLNPIILGQPQTFCWSQVRKVVVSDLMIRKTQFKRQKMIRVLLVLFNNAVSPVPLLFRGGLGRGVSPNGREHMLVKFPKGCAERLFSNLKQIAPDQTEIIRSRKSVFDLSTGEETF
ncbi:MAG: hypothetical protein R3F50_06065 [Gammaproteobacteria bacterium]